MKNILLILTVLIALPALSQDRRPMNGIYEYTKPIYFDSNILVKKTNYDTAQGFFLKLQHFDSDFFKVITDSTAAGAGGTGIKGTGATTAIPYFLSEDSVTANVNYMKFTDEAAVKTTDLGKFGFSTNYSGGNATGTVTFDVNAGTFAPYIYYDVAGTTYMEMGTNNVRITPPADLVLNPVSKNVGINEATPLNPLHIEAADSVIIRMDNPQEATPASEAGTLDNLPTSTGGGAADKYIIINIDGTDHVIPAWQL